MKMARHISRHISRLQLRQFANKFMSSSSAFVPSSSANYVNSQDGPSVCPFSGKSLLSSSSACPTTKSSSQSPVASLLPYESIPCPKGLPLIGTLFDLMTSGGAEFLHLYCDNRHRQLGPIYREKMGNVEAVFISDAQMMQKVYQYEGKYPQHMVPEPWIIYNQMNGVQRGLFFMDGHEWSSRRRSLNKLFLKPNTISEYGDVFNQVITDLLHRWDTVSITGEAKLTHLERELYNWSIESLGTMIFGRRLGCIQKDDADSPPQSHIHDFVHWVQQIFVESAKMTMVPPRLAYALNLPVWKRFVTAADNALALARSYVQENVNEIRKSESDNMDIGHIPGQGIIRQMLQNEQMDQEEIVRIITDLFIAAADTTSHATQWALYLLAKNPQCQEKLLQEVNLITKGQQVEECHLAQLPYVKGVIKEALRLYPVAPFLSRYLSHDLELGGYRIPSGSLIAMSLYTTGRKMQYFQSPEKFEPQRWIRDKVTGNHQVSNGHACLPFGHGVRSCIGRRVAEIQMQFLLSRIVQKFHLSPATPKEIGIKLRMITTPEEPIHLVIKKRN